MATSKPALSREYVYVPFTNMNITVSNLTFQKMAFKTGAVEPLDADWQTAIKVDGTSPILVPAIGQGIALLVGPLRGDSVTTFDLTTGDWQVWIDVKISGSDERIVRACGILTVNVGV